MGTSRAERVVSPALLCNGIEIRTESAEQIFPDTYQDLLHVVTERDRPFSLIMHASVILCKGCYRQYSLMNARFRGSR